MQVGATFDRQQALDGAVDKIEVADGATYTLPLSYLPSSTRTVYVMVESVAPSGSTGVTLSGHSDLTLEAVYAGGDYTGTGTTPVCATGDVVRAVYSRLDDGNETAVSEEVVFTYSGGATPSVVVSVAWSLDEPKQEEFQPYWTRSFKKSYICSKCDHHFKEGEGGLIGGVPYCRRYGCYTEEMHERAKKTRNNWR